MMGFVLIDKAKGKTSFSCVAALRKIFNVKRVGFAGTLDPLATGLLLIGVGEATKMISYLEGLDKTYETTIHLGQVSTTYDGEGSIRDVEEAVEPSKRQIEAVLQEFFHGEREQVPPVYSAIQIEGKRAYDMARKNQKVELAPRKVVFHEVEILSYEWPLLRIGMKVSKGTYVRSFAHDLGENLGCGGYVEDLRRTKIGDFSVSDAASIDEVGEGKSAYLLPVEKIFSDWKQVNLTDSDYETLAHGGFIDMPAEEWVRLEGKGLFLAMFNGICVGVLEWRGRQLKFRRQLKG